MPAHEHAIASRRNRLDRRFRNGVGIRERLHLEIVTENHPFESELLAQHAVNDRGRQGRRFLLIERRHEDVRRHHERDILANRFSKRNALHASDPIRRVLDDR